MTPGEAIAKLKKMDPNEQVTLWIPRERKRQQIESNGRLVFVLPKSQKAIVLEVFDRIAARIGSQVREQQWDWLVANVQFLLEQEGD